MAITLNCKHLEGFIKEQEYKAIAPQVAAAHETLHQGTGLGNDFLGWLTLPEDYDREEFARIQAAAKKICSDSQILIVIGIGGSYLGARAAIDLLKTPFYNSLPNKQTPDVYFAGCNISPHYLNQLLSICEGKDISVNVISKSGTTTEPALAFRVFRELLEKKYGAEEAKKRIYCTTDKARGTLKAVADREGWECFVIPDNVGGRYSVLTAVGLLPIAVAGCDIAEMMKGAAEAAKALADPDLENNPCYKYAAIRNIMYRKGKSIEILASYEPSFVMMGEWFKQLYGESEGKDQKGLFPASVAFSTDLHSMGQMIQDGRRNIFETVVDFKAPQSDFFIKEDEENADGLNFLANQNMSVVNRKALEGTVLAHVEGGTPNVLLEVPEINEYEFGWMVYFFEKACAISGYMLAVNPFDQPGVEGYKKNMFALLGKPGFEERRAMLEAQLK
ncbi:MAG: glucose-6-phosphate isomerase [Oscillospiraceae bacterium]|nr:glucose-6-phosphate isomerase [Oscillospiraceae bacterium]